MTCHHDHRTTPQNWDEEQRAHFSKVHRYMVCNPFVFCHPRAAPIPAEHWQTIAWNAAYLSAELLRVDDLAIVASDTQEVIAEMPGKLNS